MVRHPALIWTSGPYFEGATTVAGQRLRRTPNAQVYVFMDTATVPVGLHLAETTAREWLARPSNLTWPIPVDTPLRYRHSQTHTVKGTQIG